MFLENINNMEKAQDTVGSMGPGELVPNYKYSVNSIHKNE